MKDVVFYDFSFNRLAVSHRMQSVNITKKYCGFGSVELHFAVSDTDIIKLLEDNPYLWFTAGEFPAIVTGWKIDEDVAVFGRTLEWLLTKRGVAAFSKAESTPETVVREAVQSAEFIALGEPMGLGKAQEYSTASVRVLYDVVCDVLNSQNLGFEIVPDFAKKQFVFSVFCGKESPVLVSLSNRNAFDMKYTVEKQDMVTASGWYRREIEDMGEWDAVQNAPGLTNYSENNSYKMYRIKSDSYDTNGGKIMRFDYWCQKGWYLYSDSNDGKWKISASKPESPWVYMDNSGLSGVEKWDAVINGIMTESEARAAFLEMKERRDLNTEFRALEYGVDYGLGDVLRVQFETGDFRKTARKRITEVNVYFDVDKSGVMPMLQSLEE